MKPPPAILFACGLNRIRSPMAAALMRRMAGPEARVDSCGVVADLDLWPDPFAEAVMIEIGLDVSGHAAKTFENLDLEAFDRVISLSAEAHQRAVDRVGEARAEFWPTADPTLASGSRETILNAYRAVRDELAVRIRERILD
ncbi:MAG TPA: low molecular weight phosphatase family protein [Caulobacteraceae bacterium]|jgi:protein-tyrosine-phosphatase